MYIFSLHLPLLKKISPETMFKDNLFINEKVIWL